jgi:hypothetical protein
MDPGVAELQDRKFRRFLRHSLSHTFLAVDITEVLEPNESSPIPVQKPTVPYVRFNTWAETERFLMALGASPESTAATSARLLQCGTTELTII